VVAEHEGVVLERPSALDHADRDSGFGIGDAAGHDAPGGAAADDDDVVLIARPAPPAC
jgi:hypothetical protein